MRVKLYWIVLSWLVLSMAWPAVSVQAQTAQTDPTDSVAAPAASSVVTYYPEVGHTLGGLFRTYWLAHGGLAQFGFPLTEEFQEVNPSDGQTYTVQYFERERFERHPELAGTPYEVSLGLLGVQETAGRSFATVPPFVSNSSRAYFDRTGHSLGGAFKRYWEAKGDLPIYGYPISEEIQEGGFTVQWFERARMEYHPENKAPYDVLLGLLGTTTLVDQGHRLPQIFSLNYTPDTVVQGRSTRIALSGSSVPDGAVTGSLNGQPLNFQSLSGQPVAFGGVASDAAIRAQALRVAVTDDTGTVRRFDRLLGVRAGQFDHQTITIDPTVEAGVGTPEQNEQEKARNLALYKQYTPTKYWTGRFTWPLYGTVTTTFGTRRDYTDGGSEIHDGIDIAVPDRTPIHAPAAGRVVLSELQGARGNIIILDHGLGVHTAYYHQSVRLAQVGDFVKQGDVIGLAGTTGLSTGVHLHWQMQIGPIAVDPQEWVNRDF